MSRQISCLMTNMIISLARYILFSTMNPKAVVLATRPRLAHAKTNHRKNRKSGQLGIIFLTLSLNV